MKKLAFLVCLIVAAQSIACEQYEAQFIGKVKTVKNNTMFGCRLELEREFKHYAINQLCPLFQEELLQLDLFDMNCNYEAGDEISGVAVYKDTDNVAILEY